MLIRLSRTTILGCVLAIAAAGLVAGCGGGDSPSGGASPAETEAAIQQSWETFFDGSTTSKTRASLLENGEQFSKEIALVDASPLAKQASADVTSVKLDGPTNATVTYSLLLAGSPVLEGLKGSAVYVDGTWKVGVKSFCQLAALQGVTPDACPAAGA